MEDAARPFARIYRTTEKVIGTERDSTTPRVASSSEMRSRLIFQSPSFVATSISPAQFRDHYIVNTKQPDSILKRDRSAKPFDASINGHPDKNSDSVSFFSHVVGLEAGFGEVTNVDASKRMNFTSYHVLGENPNFVDLRLLTVNTADKLNSVFAPVTRVEGLTDHSNWLASRHCIAEVTEGRVSEVQSYSNYIKNSEFEMINIFENIQMTRPENIQMTRSENIKMTRPKNIQMTRPYQNIPLTGLNQNIPLTRLNQIFQ